MVCTVKNKDVNYKVEEILEKKMRSVPFIFLIWTYWSLTD